MSNLESMYKAIEFIEAHLQEDIGIADVAEAVHYSLYHFCRMFNKTIQHTPYDYLMRRRLSESARELVETDKKIIEIAFDYQFNSPETFCRAFKRMFEIQPSQWKKRGQIPFRSLMPPLSYDYMAYLHNNACLKPELIKLDPLHIAGLMSYIKDDMDLIPELWRMLGQQETGHVARSKSQKYYYGVVFHSQSCEHRGFFYMAGMEIATPNEHPPLWVVTSLPESNYVRFINNGQFKELHFIIDYIYHTWLSRSRIKQSLPIELLCYGNNLKSIPHKCDKIEIYIPVVQ